MLLGLKELEKLEIFLENLIKKEKIYKYRIYLNLDTTISVDIVSDKDNKDEIEDWIKNNSLIKIFIDEWINQEEYEKEKEYYKKLFEKKIDKEHRRRLINLIDKKEKDIKSNNNTHVVTFYSYKGGVGRTTSLVTFANYYAYQERKKVVILDFDFEAPGLTNYFDFSLDAFEDKGGVLEYILDKKASIEKLNLSRNYIIEVSKEYSGDGSIYVMPSGNLFGQKNLESYIEALARIDINSTDTITNQILDLINDINKAINPDVILIDSRTGFNDIFGFLIHRISNTIVGLFEGNKQTEPGLKLFLNEIYTKGYNNNLNAILVNSLVHKDSGYSKRIKEFSKSVQDYLVELTDDNFVPEIFDLRKSNILGNIGTVEDDKDDYFEFIQENTPNDYKKFFNKIIESVEQSKKKECNKRKLIKENKNKKLKDLKEINLNELKINLLEKINKNYPQNYAENITYDNDFLNKQFYFRKSMEDIFNFDKFLLIGTKGTGKTAFYLALRNMEFVNNLRKKANKNKFKFKVIDIISLKQDRKKSKYFEVKNFNQESIKDKEFFYRRFWIIYILNSILLDKDKINFNISNEVSDILPIKLIGSVENKNFFERIIYSDKEFSLIENELKRINIYLRKSNIHLMITFDQLDYIVKPINWSEIISPLIDYCRSMPYFQIQPKLFIRRDLFNKLTNITNKKALEIKSINLEWSKEELFAFFFKIIFAYSKEEFFEIMNRYRIKSPIINSIKKQIEKPHSYNQINLDIFFIEILVETFFGEYPIPSNSYYGGKFAKTYNWFYDSLADANDTISLRPFLDLIKYAIDKFFISNKDIKNINDKPILHPDFYNNRDVRRKCLTDYFDDLANEEGNEDFKTIVEYIRDNSNFPGEFKYRKIYGDKYNRFFNYFLENDKIKLKYCKKIGDIEETLQINGVISIEYIKRGFEVNKRFTFAFLYKYYLGLKG